MSLERNIDFHIRFIAKSTDFMLGNISHTTCLTSTTIDATILKNCVHHFQFLCCLEIEMQPNKPMFIWEIICSIHLGNNIFNSFGKSSWPIYGRQFSVGNHQTRWSMEVIATTEAAPVQSGGRWVVAYFTNKLREEFN